MGGILLQQSERAKSVHVTNRIQEEGGPSWQFSG